MSRRWAGPSPDSLAAAQRIEELKSLKAFPSQSGRGSWRFQSAEKLSETAANMLECAGYFVHTYENQETGETVQVAILLGPAGPISLHTPEVCFPSRAYQPRGERQRVTLPRSEGSDEAFWAVTFKSPDLNADMCRVYYAWSTGGRWSAPGGPSWAFWKKPRFVFAGLPYLYKIQLISYLPLGTDQETDDPCKRFLQDFVPVVKNHLVEPSDN